MNDLDNETGLVEKSREPTVLEEHDDDGGLVEKPRVPLWRVIVSIALLLCQYFLAQYDKFILSYFQDSVISSLHLSQANYGIISGYATGIVYAFLAIPTAYIADYTSKRIWVLSIAATWWSLCAIFQGLSHNFWQILLARIGMGIGQAPVEALSVSLISDLMDKRYVFFGASVLYVGVYIGEAISGQIATAFTASNTPWNHALIAIGIVGIVVAILVRLFLREPVRQTPLVPSDMLEDVFHETSPPKLKARESGVLYDIKATIVYILRMHSFWILALSASFRQLAGNVFGYYMPTFLSTSYSSYPKVLSRYGIIVGTCGSFAVLFGGFLTSVFWSRTKVLPLYLTGAGGMVSSIFVLLMIFSKSLGGIKTLYGTMCAAYLTAELWLGAINSLIALLLPPHYKTFGLAVWSAIQVLIYSSGPEIMGLALRNVDNGSQEYLTDTKVALAVIIPVGYWIAGIGFLCAIPLVKKDLRQETGLPVLTLRRKAAFVAFGLVLTAVVIVLFVMNIVYKA